MSKNVEKKSTFILEFWDYQDSDASVTVNCFFIPIDFHKFKVVDWDFSRKNQDCS